MSQKSLALRLRVLHTHTRHSSCRSFARRGQSSKENGGNYMLHLPIMTNCSLPTFRWLAKSSDKLNLLIRLDLHRRLPLLCHRATRSEMNVAWEQRMENETTARACMLVNAGYDHGVHLATPPPANTIGGEGHISRGKVGILSFRAANWRKGVPLHRVCHGKWNLSLAIAGGF